MKTKHEVLGQEEHFTQIPETTCSTELLLQSGGKRLYINQIL
jgi:hypothetical protein